jgi:protein subunit release factor A
VPNLEGQIHTLEEAMGAPDFWDDADKARDLTSKAAAMKKKLEGFLALESRVADIEEGIALAKEFDDNELAAEAIANASTLETDIRTFELVTLLNHPDDPVPCFLAISAGAGGTEACDWAQMLMRMYVRWAERKGYTVETLDVQDGDEAGIRTATIKITGENAYGFLKNERGVHRLVRIRARKGRTANSRLKFSRRSSTRSRRINKKPKPSARMVRKATSPGATRSALMCSSHTKKSSTSAPVRRPATFRM